MTPAAKKARNTAYIARFAFGASLAASIAANVIATAPHGPIGIGIGLWTPVSFLFSVALLERVEMKGRAATLRKIGIGLLAAIVGWISYGHMVDVALSGGMDSLSAHLIPLTVDIMIALAQPSMKIKQAAAPARRRAAATKKAAPAKLKSVA